jgi:hypothetical protein
VGPGDGRQGRSALRRRGPGQQREAVLRDAPLLDSVAAKLFATTDPSHHLDIDHGRGRSVHRQIRATDAEGIDFPGAAQIFRIRRDVFDPSGQRISKEVVYGITSLAEATAEAIGRWVRLHWDIETRSTGFATSSSLRTTRTPTLEPPPTVWPCFVTWPSG